MGAFLGTPVTEKISENAENGDLICGGSSMQGWRSTQEDAHNCILDFDEKTSLFAVYDGHGGADVAIYSALHLPNAIKQTESYIKGDYAQALKDAFLEFDSTLITEKVVKELEKIAQKHNGEAEEEEETQEDEDDECVNNLYEEATMPIADVIARYKNPSLSAKLPSSPFLRAKKGESDAGASSSSSSFEAPGCSSSSSVSNSDAEVSSSSGGAAAAKKEAEAAVSESASPSSSGPAPAPSCTSSSSPSKSKSNSDPDSSSCNNIDSAASSTSKKETTEKPLVNGLLASVSSSQNGEAAKKEEKAKDAEVSEGSGDSEVKSSKSNSDNVISSSDGAEVCNKSQKKRITPGRCTKLYEKLLTQGNGMDSSESDEDDENFEGNHADSDDEEDGELEGEEEDEMEEDEDDSDDEELEEEEESDDELDDDEDDGFCFPNKEKVGEDSGCTAVVALVHGDTIYVANAGDSRCVVSQKREAVEMSFDHKPEDPPEKSRIVNAGGKVTADGRVNGGLNLSRALGDHSYKQNKSLGPTEQMISALPDIKTLTIDRANTEFMVLACDGIWNSMTSQEVVDFVGERIDKAKKLTDICEEMFDACLAPNTIGDGTGCDNMTCIIVRWKKPSESNGLESNSATSESKSATEDNQPAATPAVSSASKSETEKRSASPDVDETSRKKSKIEGDSTD